VLEKTSGIGADLILELGGGGTLARSLESAKINGRTFNFDQLKAADEYLRSGQHFGKIVIRLD